MSEKNINTKKCTNPKLGLLFLIKENLNQPQIWEEYISQSPGGIRIFSHPKYPKRTVQDILKGTVVPGLVETEWGHVSLVSAMLSLLKYAVETDENLTHFMFVSEGCVPIKPWSALLDYLQNDSRTCLSLEGYDEMKYFHRDRHEQSTGISPEHWKIHPQWCLLDREAAGCILQEDVTDRFENVFAADEHYMGTVLAMRNFPEDRIAGREVTRVEWGTYGACSFDKVSEELLEELKEFSGFFARKFSPLSNIGQFHLHEKE